MADPDGGNLWLYLILLVVLILLSAFFAMSEIAVISLNDAKLKKMAQDGNKKAILLEKVLSSPSRFLATSRVGVTFCGLLASAFTANAFAGKIEVGTANPLLVRGLSIVILTLILTFLLLVFGEMLPKQIAMKHGERIAFAFARPLRAVSLIERPFVAIVSGITELILKLFGMKAEQENENVTEEEIRMMIDVGNENGSIEQSDREMINNIFEFDDRTAGDIMTHRTEMTALPLTATLEECIRTAVDTGYSRIPVYEEDLDDIVGILYSKDLLELVLSAPPADFQVRHYMRQPLYVPETNHCKELFQELQSKKVQLAIVVDEYGGTAGMVTMEDLLESIVGNIQDEYDEEEETVEELAPGVYRIDGLAQLEELDKLFGLQFEEDADYDTVGGYLIDELGYIPSEEEHPTVTLASVVFTVESVDERRIDKVRAERIEPSEETDDPDGEE